MSGNGPQHEERMIAGFSTFSSASGVLAAADARKRHFRLGSKAEAMQSPRDVRCTSDSGHISTAKENIYSPVNI